MNGNKLDFMNININNIDTKYLEKLQNSIPDVDSDLQNKNVYRDYIISTFVSKNDGDIQ